MVGAWIDRRRLREQLEEAGNRRSDRLEVSGRGRSQQRRHCRPALAKSHSPGTYGAWLVESSSITWASLPYADPTQWQLLAVANVAGGATSNALVWENLSSGLLGAWGIPERRRNRLVAIGKRLTLPCLDWGRQIAAAPFSRESPARQAYSPPFL